MGLLTLLRKMKKTQTELRLLVLGLDAAGKTSILKRLADEDPMETQTTQGFNLKSVHTEGVKLNMWDIGGQKSIRHYWTQFCDDVDVLIYVVDAADKRRLEETGIELNNLLTEERLNGVPLLVFSNKMDLMTALPPGEISTALTLHNIRDRKWHIQGCSAKTGEGIQEGIDWVTRNGSKS